MVVNNYFIVITFINRISFSPMKGIPMTTDEKREHLRNQLCFSVYSTALAINRLYKPLLDPIELTYPQFLVLRTLWEEDGQGIGDIADQLSLEPSTITPLVKRLEQAGFVTRNRNTTDERQVHVRLTQKGRDVQGKTDCLKEALFKKAGMSDDELARLNKDIRRLLDGLTA